MLLKFLPWKASGLSKIPELDFSDSSYSDSVGGVFPREGGLPFNFAAKMLTELPQLCPYPHPPSPWGLPLGASRPK